MAIALVALALLFAGSARASIQLSVRGKPFSCPDPSITEVPQFSSSGGRYTEACTTDLDPNAFSLYTSNDPRGRWRFTGYVFPAGHQPSWALSSTGAGGRYWSPEIHWINNRWVVYFAAVSNTSNKSNRGNWVVGVAWSKSLHGPWKTKLLHWRGQFNYLGGQQELYGGVIDPSEAQDPQTNQRYIYWADQHTSLWGAKLSPDGLTMSSDVHQLLWAQRPYDCDTSSDSSCCVEGPAAFFKNVNGQEWTYLLYSSRSTWHGTYQMWASASRNPLGVFKRLPDNPIIHSGNGWWGPGGGSAPVLGPQGTSWWIPYHATRSKENVGDKSWRRLGLIGKVRWIDTAPPGAHSALPPTPLIGTGRPG